LGCKKAFLFPKGVPPPFHFLGFIAFLKGICTHPLTLLKLVLLTNKKEA
jgi:hypothetical protein